MKAAIILFCFVLLTGSLLCPWTQDSSVLAQYRRPPRKIIGIPDHTPSSELAPPSEPQVQPHRPQPQRSRPVSSPWVFPNSDRRYLTDGDLRYLSSDQLWKARNEIFARRGYRFHTPRGIAYGRSLGSYYRPRESNGSTVYGWMNDYEKHNIERIKRYERSRR